MTTHDEALFESESARARASRHILLKEIGVKGARRIAGLSALVIGAGGVGCPAALCLAEAGIRELTLIDADAVEESNLARQILHTPARLGMNKAQSAAQALADINPAVKVNAVAAWADEESIKRLGREVDVILDCSDNFATRHAANRAALNLSKPLVTVSAIRYSLQVAFFDFTKPASACYACVFPEDEEADVKASQVGVLAPVTGFAGMIAAEEVLKWAAGMESLAGSMLVLDTLSWQMQRFAFAKMPDCTVCAGR